VGVYYTKVSIEEKTFLPTYINKFKAFLNENESSLFPDQAIVFVAYHNEFGEETELILEGSH